MQPAVEVEAESRAFLPSAEGSGVAWIDKHKNFTKSADCKNLSFFTPLFSPLADWFPWMVNGQEPESTNGKYYRNANVLKIAHVSCGVTDCLSENTVLCFLASDIVSLHFSEDKTSSPRQPAKCYVLFTNNSLVQGSWTLSWRVQSYIHSWGLWEIYKSW